jgi:hypothetical protein
VSVCRAPACRREFAYELVVTVDATDRPPIVSCFLGGEHGCSIVQSAMVSTNCGRRGLSHFHPKPPLAL